MSMVSLSTSAASLAAAIHDDRIHLLLAASGSVATIKLPLIISALKHHPNLSIRVILTTAAAHFLGGQSSEQPTVASLASLPNVEAVYLDDDWAETQSSGTDTLLLGWAHLLVVAPLSANTLAKIVNGISDNLLTSVIHSWDARKVVNGKIARILVAASMNTAMWAHPVTAQQIRVLEEDWGVGVDEDGKDGVAGQGWFEVLRPINKTLACGDVGSGAMLEWTAIVTLIEQRLGLEVTAT